MKAETLRLEGVGLLLFSDKGRLLVLRELESKPFISKELGMLTFPLETIELGESPQCALGRLMTEEVGTINVHSTYQFQSLEFIHPECIVKIYTYVSRVDNEFIANPADNDVLHYGWMTPEQLLVHAHKRIEVSPIIGAYLNQT